MTKYCTRCGKEIKGFFYSGVICKECYEKNAKNEVKEINKLINEEVKDG